MIKVSKSTAVILSLFLVLFLMSIVEVNECSASMPVYRFYNDAMKTHFYTIDENEKTELQADAGINGWVYEGVAWNAYATQAAGTLPVYRLYSDGLKTHLYTMDENEKNILMAGTIWKYEGVAYYAYPNPSGYPVPVHPVYRLYSDGLKRHLYTADFHEASLLSSGSEAIWVLENIVWYVEIVACCPNEVVMHHDCPLLQESGGDNPETHIVEMFQSSGKFDVSWETYSIKDRIFIEYEGQIILDTGCVGEYNSKVIEINGTSTEILVRVSPNCEGTTGTLWEIQVDCPY